MKLKDIEDKNINLQCIKIKLTEKMVEAYKNYCSKGESEIYLIGCLMRDFFISPQPPGTKGSRKLYPLPLEVETNDFLECEAVEILKEKGK